MLVLARFLLSLVVAVINTTLYVFITGEDPTLGLAVALFCTTVVVSFIVMTIIPRKG